jgi:hypothetical protein
MRQRGFVVPVTLIVYAVAAMVLLGAVGVVQHKVRHWCNEACNEARSERDTLAAEKAAALKREAAIATLYGQQVAATQAAEAQREAARNEHFTTIEARARALPAGDARVRIPASVVGVLADAAGAANAAGSAGGAQATVTTPAAPADSTGELMAGWFVDVARIHAECRDRVAQWEAFYSGLRAAQSSEVPIDGIH